MSDNNLENSPEQKESGVGFNHKIESIIKSLEEVKESEDDQNHKVFWIVVGVLRDEGLELPDSNITGFRKIYAGEKNSFVSVIIEKGKNKEKEIIRLIFDLSRDETIVGINREDNYILKGEDDKTYRNRYLPYALRFLEVEKTVLQDSSKLGKARLEKFGV